MAVRDLTVKERILLHLFDYNRFAEEYEAPHEVTQSGIARAVGIRVQHVTQYTKPLIENGAVEEGVKHIQQRPRRRKAYFLSARGRHQVAALRHTLLRETVRFMPRSGKIEEVALSRIYQQERRGSRLLSLLQELEASGYITEVIAEAEPGLVDCSQEAPPIEKFYGRREELAQVVQALDAAALVVVTGIAGIGKTTLGSRVCEEFQGKRSLFWRRIRPWDSAMDLALRLAKFMQTLGRTSLRAYLEGRSPKEWSRVEEIVDRDLAGVNALLVFDDAHKVSHDAEAFLSILFSAMKRQEASSVLLLSREVPGFYSRRDVALESSVAEVTLGGLDT